MNTSNPRPGLVSQDHGGLWMKMDCGLEADHGETPSLTSSESPQDKITVKPPAQAETTRHCCVTDAEGADDVFNSLHPPPPLSSIAPAEGSTDARANNSSVTHSNVADATEAKANPSSLGWHHDENQFQAAQNEVNEVIANTAQSSKESMDVKDKDPTPPTDEDTGSLMATCHDPSGKHHQGNASRDKESTEESGNIELGQETEETRGKYPKDVPNSEDICGHIETEVCKQNQADSATFQPQDPKTPTEVTSEDEEHVDIVYLNYNLTKSDWVRRESSTSETEECQRPISKDCVGMVMKREHGDERKNIETDLHQGEQLLQRLQLLQQQQDVQEKGDEEKGVSERKVDDFTAREVNLTDGIRRREVTFHTVTDEEAKLNLVETETSGHPEDQIITRAEDDDDNSDDDQQIADCSPMNLHETAQIPNLFAQHRYSTAETSMERQIQEANQAKQNLQRAGGMFNLADNPDVLEIPFKTNISLEPLTCQVDQPAHSDVSQFSEQKMKKEIRQEIQRELVLVNQGKIPGLYSKEEVRQLQETKLLFEAFQQDNTEGPARHRKLATTLVKSHVYPSVLERTHSLEMFCLQSCPVTTAHSLGLFESAPSEGEKSPEHLRSKSPTGGSRDKTRLSPYPKQDKHPRMHRSMDSISTEVPTSAVEARSKTREGNTRRQSPTLQQNPFFKLRPALVLQPEVEKDIREAREREEELRRQRCTLYGEDRQNSQEEDKSQFAKMHLPDDRRQSRGKLELVWPPPSKKDQWKSEQPQQESKVHRAGGQKSPLWQRWESGQINGQSSKKNN
ncbi:hypothetical protein JOB18_049167 [Solea senegalensis]|uniref:A-kinase anchor protein 2 C-terminal domain-containing protein n=1 Tax=Solea senegalensis TaxID=28829 RepID=A0AAV6RL42_SOLSE|nr:uncharacterized protein LOC122784768 isoform X2 [Solea senegalensis]KAG7506211.1 hypothetical protein JOB18_049167 [Solea senegalensis]